MKKTGKVFLFSGHMIDAPDRSVPRFPADKEKIARKAIEKTLKELHAGADDLAISSGACGGDLLFAEACLDRGLSFEMRLPFPVPEFLERSVLFADQDWEQRFFKVKEHPNTRVYYMQDELGELPVDENPYEKCNLWMLERAISFGKERVNFICLWDGKGGDGPGGTRHMIRSIRQRSGYVTILDTNQLFFEE